MMTGVIGPVRSISDEFQTVVIVHYSYSGRKLFRVELAAFALRGRDGC